MKDITPRNGEWRFYVRAVTTSVQSNERENPSNMVDIPDHFDRNSFFRNILITDEVVVRLGAEPGVAAVEEGGPHGEGGAGLGHARHRVLACPITQLFFLARAVTFIIIISDQTIITMAVTILPCDSRRSLKQCCRARKPGGSGRLVAGTGWCSSPDTWP